VENQKIRVQQPDPLLPPANRQLSSDFLPSSRNQIKSLPSNNWIYEAKE
jgi:hypothetical protein